jgi:hypothetical protein
MSSVKKEIINDDFHAEMRKKMKDIYYNHGGKDRATIRKFLYRYGLSKDILNDYQTDEEKLLFLRQYAKQQRNKKHIEPAKQLANEIETIKKNIGELNKIIIEKTNELNRICTHSEFREEYDDDFCKPRKYHICTTCSQEFTPPQR